jgi:hypothetical protein
VSQAVSQAVFQAVSQVVLEAEVERLEWFALVGAILPIHLY